MSAFLLTHAFQQRDADGFQYAEHFLTLFILNENCIHWTVKMIITRIVFDEVIRGPLPLLMFTLCGHRSGIRSPLCRPAFCAVWSSQFLMQGVMTPVSFSGAFRSLDEYKDESRDLLISGCPLIRSCSVQAQCQLHHLARLTDLFTLSA